LWYVWCVLPYVVGCTYQLPKVDRLLGYRPQHALMSKCDFSDVPFIAPFEVVVLSLVVNLVGDVTKRGV
jgi:hypothetical protein